MFNVPNVERLRNCSSLNWRSVLGNFAKKGPRIGRERAKQRFSQFLLTWALLEVFSSPLHTK